MADKSKFSLFGFRLNRSKEETPQENIPSFTTPPNEDGATTISSSAFYSQTIDLDGVVKNEVELITRYREMALQPEIDSAIEDIINEAIVQDDDGRCVDIVTDTIELSDKLREAIEEEFDNVLTLLNFKNMGSDIFRRYYVDGRLNYHVIIDNENPKKGIQELRYIDPRKIRKIREVKKQKDTETGISVITGVEEYYVYNDKIVSGTTASSGIEGIKIAADSVVNVTSGLMDARRAVVLSYLHKSIKPLNQLRMIEDASIIYKLCLVGDTRIKTDDGWKYIKDVKNGDVVYSYYGPDEGLKPTKVVKQWKTGKKQTYKVSSMHHQIVGSDNHPILVLDRQTKTVEYVDIKDLIPKRHAFTIAESESEISLTEYPIQQFENIISIEEAEIEDVYEIEVESEKHNFVANGIIVHNSRAPSRRIFYVNVGDMPKLKAEQYLRDMMNKYKNKIVYDSQSGQTRSDTRHLSILEDFWIPRKSDGSTTEVKTLESNDNFSNMDMVEYFQRGLYKSLNVPVSRIDSQGAYNIGRSAEISREEIKFAKFIDKLRRKFSVLFDQLMRIQLVLKGICTLEEWEEYKEKLYYDFIKDNNYTELKEAELMQGRLGILAIIDPYTGKYFSKEWIQRNVLRLNDDVILEMEKQIEKEKVEDLKQQEEDQKNQIVLQAQGLQLQNQLMPQPDQQIDAGAEEEQPQEPAPRKQAHPYEV